jgi:NifU-like protein involved in Fe-S cluster formation
MKLQIRVDDNGKITDAKFKTFGCGSAIASSSYMTELVKGLSIEEAGKIKNTEIAKELCLPPVKLHCSSKLDRHYVEIMLTESINSARRGCNSVGNSGLSEQATKGLLSPVVF